MTEYPMAVIGLGATGTVLAAALQAAFFNRPNHLVCLSPENRNLGKQVAKETITALKKRKKPVVISGIMNRSMLLSQRFLGRKQVVTIMGRSSPVK